MTLTAEPITGYKNLIVEKKGPVLEAWLNRPEARNALNHPLEQEWQDVLDRADDDSEIKVVTLRGKGPVFSAGHDLKEVAAGYSKSDQPSGLPKRRIPTLNRGWYCRKTMIAGVHGYVGPAAQRLLATFDFVLATEDTRFSFEQARMGSGDPGGNILAFLLPLRVLKQYWLLGGWMDAQTALDLHYVQRVLPNTDALATEIDKWAKSACGLQVEQIAKYKEGIHRQVEIMGLNGIIGIGNHYTGHGNAPDQEFFTLIQERGMKEALRFRQGDVDQSVTKV
jgi:enoyl-CoA hydratase/carnithine racemase